MARKRFSDLNRVVDALRLAGANLDSLPQNLDFVKYAKFLQGDGEPRNIIRPDLGDAVQVGVIAFGLPDTDALAKIQLDWNTRAQTFYNGLASNALFGIEGTTLTDYNENPNFKPAQVVIKARKQGVAETSKITGRPYKKNDNPSYTIPLGQTATVKYFQEAVQGLLDSPLGAGYHISASPEEWRRN
ncbi:MAG: hypothetical protein AB4063_24655 [Crocosphaera sp.]